MKELFKKWQVILVIVCAAISLLLISNIHWAPVEDENDETLPIGPGNGLSYGRDFAGGVEIVLQLEQPVDQYNMSIMKSILEDRLNGIGLADVKVIPYGDQQIIIPFAAASPSERENIKTILKQQAKFEQRIDGVLAATGDCIRAPPGPQSSKITTSGSGGATVYNWAVAVQYSSPCDCMFGQAAKGKYGRPVDAFIDRPENTTVLLDKLTYDELSEMEDDYGDSWIKVIEERSQIPVVVAGVAEEHASGNVTNVSSNVSNTGDNETINEDNETVSGIDKTIADLNKLKEQGYTRVILAGGEDRISEELRNRLEEEGFYTERVDKGDESTAEFIKGLTGLRSSPRLNIPSTGECQDGAEMTGSSPVGPPDNKAGIAKFEIAETQILLNTGNLPVNVEIGTEIITPPSLGKVFLDYSAVAGLIAIVVVATSIFMRYRRMFIVVPIIITGVSEIMIILGFASAIHWQLDLAAVAGIIAAVGTGVDDQIIITDETIARRGKREKRVISISQRIARAFTIIFVAAATTIAAMMPLISVTALKGFAIVTIIGVIIGVFITRPAYAKAIEYFIGRE